MTAQTIIYFVRHGQTDWNAEGRLQGQEDTSLNDLGRSQATGNGERLAELIPDASLFDFVSSPLWRTRETMERLRAAMGLEPTAYRTEQRLLEVHFGGWQGHTFAELETVDPGCFARRELDKWHFVPPGENAESYAMLTARVKNWLDQAAPRTVCVAHGGVLRAIFRLTETLSPVDCAALSIPQDRVLRFVDGKLDWL